MIELHFDNQQPQANGYWLQTWHRVDKTPHLLPIQFALHLKNPQQAGFNAQLMMQEAEPNSRTGDSGRKIQFLSPKKLLNPQKVTFPFDLHQKWSEKYSKNAKIPSPAPVSKIFYGFYPVQTLQNHLKHWVKSFTNQTLLITAQGNQIATALHLIQYLRQLPKSEQPNLAVLLQADAERKFPFQPKPALMLFDELAQIAPEAIGMMPLLEDWSIANRLCNPEFQAGCYQGTADELIQIWQQKEGITNWQNQWHWLKLCTTVKKPKQLSR